MKLRSLVPIALSAMALMASTASSASATTMEIGGTAQNQEITYTFRLKVGFSFIITDTSGFAANTCKEAHIHGHVSFPFDAVSVLGGITSFYYKSCTEGNPTVDSAGTLSFERIGTTTNGTVRSNGLKITVPSFFGTLTCTTSNTDFGTLTGVSSGEATLDVNAVVSCTVIGDSRWQGTLSASTPSGLGVTS
jgi:hypothetical protein